MNLSLQQNILPQNYRFYSTTQTAYWAGLLTHTVGFIFFLVLGIHQMAIFNGLVSVPFFVFALTFNYKGKHNIAFLLAIFELYTHQVHGIYYLGWTSGWHYWFIVLSALIFFNPDWKKWTRVTFLVGIATTFTVMYLFFPEGNFQMDAPSITFAHLMNSLSTLILVAVLISYYTKATRKAEKQLNEANSQLVEKNEEVQAQHDQIVMSIAYAERIQQAVMPNTKVLERHFEDHFILFQPKDVVSGDFYWFSEIENKLVLVCADCTGHGVPGGFMSMLGITQLNEIVNHQHILQPAQILERLRTNVKETLGDGRQKDGMDMSVCLIDKNKQELYFAGAFSNLFMVRNHELSEFKATRNPIGTYAREIPFEEMHIKILPDDKFYLYTDGFLDQFGGEYGDKYMRKRLRNKLTELAQYAIGDQCPMLYNEFKHWKGNYPQTDDSTMIGFRIL